MELQQHMDDQKAHYTHTINTKRPQKLLTVPKVSADAQRAEQNGLYFLVLALHGSQGASEEMTNDSVLRGKNRRTRQTFQATAEPWSLV